MGQSPPQCGSCGQCRRSCGHASVKFLSHIDVVGLYAGGGRPEPERARCEKSCECCMLDEINVEHVVGVTNAVAALPSEFHTRLDADMVPFKSLRVPVHESNCLLRALAGKQERRASPQHDADEGHGPAAVTRSVTLVDVSLAEPLKCTKISATLVIDYTFSTMKFVPDLFSQLPRILISIDKIVAICPGEDVLSDLRCLDQSQIPKAVLIEYMSECCKTSKSVCFILESRKGQHAFVKALTAIWQERRSHSLQKQCAHIPNEADAF